MKSLPTAQRGLRKWLQCVVTVVAITLSTSSPVLAQSAQSAAYVVGNDFGGVVGTRAARIQRLKVSGRRVEIRGLICLSSCTMFLGAGKVCVNPSTRFGFHGPSFYGRPLLPA